MADLSISSIKLVSGSPTVSLPYGGTVSAGDPVYQTTDRDYEQAGASTATLANAAGIALIDGVADGQAVIAGNGCVIDVGAILTKGTTYVVSATTGAIAPQADLTSGDFITSLGIAISTSQLSIKIHATGVDL